MINKAQKFGIILIVSFLLFICLDLLWFKLISYKYIYHSQFKSINNGEFSLRTWSGVIVWFLMAITVSVYLINCDLSHLNASILWSIHQPNRHYYLFSQHLNTWRPFYQKTLTIYISRLLAIYSLFTCV